MATQGAAAPIWLSHPAPHDQPTRNEHTEAFLADCLHGLAQPRKSLPCKWLYDAVGSALFEKICETPEYYPSRTEMVLLAEAAPWLGATLPPNSVLIEFGSGASRKTRLLLDAASAITGYVPIDISEAELALGNFTPDDAVAFLSSARALLGAGSRLLLGVDVAKDVDTLVAAYDDAAGVTPRSTST